MEILEKIKGGISRGRERLRLPFAEVRKKTRTYLSEKDETEEAVVSETMEEREMMPLFEEEGSRSIRERLEALRTETIARIRNTWKNAGKQYALFESRLTARERVALLLIIGAALGIGLKLIATEYVTIGYYDYTRSNGATYNLIEIQKKAVKEGKVGAFSGGLQNAGACSQ